jgi:hypothetical protein
MKTSLSNLILTALILLASTSIKAVNTPLISNSYNEDIIREGFVSKLDSPADNVLQFTEETAFVHFTINTMNEIVILTTGTNNPDLDAFIKRTLNYERIDVKNILIERDYYIKVTFKKSNYKRAIL